MFRFLAAVYLTHCVKHIVCCGSSTDAQLVKSCSSSLFKTLIQEFKGFYCVRVSG